MRQIEKKWRHTLRNQYQYHKPIFQGATFHTFHKNLAMNKKWQLSRFPLYYKCSEYLYGKTWKYSGADSGSTYPFISEKYMTDSHSNIIESGALVCYARSRLTGYYFAEYIEVMCISYLRKIISYIKINDFFPLFVCSIFFSSEIFISNLDMI